MSPPEPIPETLEALNNLDPLTADADPILSLTRLARAQHVVADLVCVTVAKLDDGLTFTLVATPQQIAVLDGVQYAAGGPCVEAARRPRDRRRRRR